MSKIISFEPTESIDSQNDDIRQSKKRKIGFQPNVLDSVENTLASREESRSCESNINGQVGHKRKRGGQISISGPKEPNNLASPSPVKKALIRSSSSLRAAVTRVQVRKPLPNFHVSFGRPLSEVIPVGEQVPVVVSECIRFLLPQFISEEGLFRKSGSQQSIQSIRQAIDATGQVREIITSESDCHAIAGVLKLYIRLRFFSKLTIDREMPNSLIPFELQDKFLEVVRNKEIASNPETQITLLEAALAELDQNEYTLVRTLCQMNYQISLHHEQNLMTPNNLARVWAPNMIKTTSVNPMEIMQFTDHANILMTVLITQSPFLFKQENLDMQSEELACMAASASIDESLKEYSNLTKTPSLNSLLSSKRIELGDMIVEEPITPRSASSENQDDGSDSLMRSSSDLAAKFDLARSSSDISEKKSSSFDNVNEKRKQLIKRTSMMGKNIIKAHQTPSKNQTGPVEEPVTPTQVTIAPEAISTPSRPQMHRTRSSVFKNLNNVSRTSLETSSSNIIMDEAPTNDSNLKPLSKSISLELPSKNTFTKPKISLLYHEPSVNSLLDQKVKDLSVPRLKNRIESKQPISVDEATKFAKSCKKLILIDSKTEQVTHSLYLSDMTDLEIKKSIINIETFNLVCPSLVVKTSKKESFLVIGWSAFVWNSILENEDCSYLSM